MTSALLRFHAGAAPDAAGRSLDAILAWDDQRLEAVHDYVQWLFPLPEPSGFNPDAPLLTASDIAAFHADPALQSRLRAAWIRMLRFYGFAAADGQVVPAAEFPARAATWLAPGNHNLLRITRILRSLSLLGLQAEARGFLAALEALRQTPSGAVIPERTMRFWRDAVIR